MALIDLTGRRIGRLTVVRLLPKSGPHREWECRCSCGTTHVTRSTNLLREDTKSCGCAQQERRTAFKTRWLKHGHRRGRKSGHKENPTYQSWYAMNARCRRTGGGAYKWYGANGITVCARWRGKTGFRRFLEDMGERPVGKTLDRIDARKGYSPSNCRWATRREQRNNRRDTKFYTYNGKTMCLTDWVREITGSEARVNAGLHARKRIEGEICTRR